MFALIAAAATAVATPAAKPTTLTLSPEQLRQLQQQFGAAASGPQSPLQAHAAWLTHTFAGLFILSALLLIVLLAIQTTKQEGLSGTIGGRVESAYKGRVGFDKQLQRITSGVAIAFVLFATLVSLSGI